MTEEHHYGCPMNLDERQNHYERFLDSLNQRIDTLYEKVVLGNENDSLTVSVAKLIENQLEDRQKLNHLEQKIDHFSDRQTQDFLEIKDAIHNLGTIGMLFQKGGWKLIGFILTLFALMGWGSTWIYDLNANPRIFSDPAQFELLKEIIRETVNSVESGVHSPPDNQ